MPLPTSTRFLSQIALHGIVITLSVIWFTPTLALLITSLRPEGNAVTSGWWHVFVDRQLVLDNYRAAFAASGFASSIVNSLTIALPTVAGTVLFSAAGAFALAQMRFYGRMTVFLSMVALQILPPQLTLVPMLKVFLGLGLTGTFVPVWLIEMGLTVPFGVFLLYGFFSSIPSDLLEAARIDGASEPTIFVRIVLPLSGSILASLAILQFMIAWNHLLVPMIFLGGSESLAPLTVRVATLAQTESGGQSVLTAATFISVLVPLLILISMQKYFVRGVLGGSVKG